MCIGGSGNIPPAPPPVAPPPPPPQITVTPAPSIAPLPELKKTQLAPDNPTRKRRGTSRRGKAMLKIPMNTSSGSGVNV